MALQKPLNRSKKAIAAAATANISILRNSGYPEARAIGAGLSITKKLTPKKKSKAKK